MKFQKKYIVLASLVLALGTAVYINWQFGSAGTGVTSKELGAASYVSATVGNSSSDDQAVQTMALSKEQQSYFANERNKRKETQDDIIDSAEKVFDLEKSSDEEKNDAQVSVEKIIKRFTIQDSIESIIKAKGFSDCLCVISDDGVTVIVPDNELNNTAALVIDDAVTSHYKVDYDKISIVGV